MKIYPVVDAGFSRLVMRGASMALAAFVSTALVQAVEPVTLNWLDGRPPATPQSVNWGVPWPRGQVQKSDALVLKSADGKAVTVQTWPLAYWPDGSLMWTGQSVTATPDTAGPLQLAVGAATKSVSRRAVQSDGKNFPAPPSC